LRFFHQSKIMAKLGVNIDHVATLREARYRNWTRGLAPEPDPVQAARLCVQAGASGITVHLREDRRHILDQDVRLIRQKVRTTLNLEMAVTPAMVRTALRLKPDEVCLVPENRREITTEGGLNLLAQQDKVAHAVKILQKAGIVVSLFIDPDLQQIRAAGEIQSDAVELHTGAYANAGGNGAVQRELKRQRRAAEAALALGLQVNAGHGLHYVNLKRYLRAMPPLSVLNIGHAIVSRSIETGLVAAVRQMLAIIRPSS
jgi:pyridoxine 5-phosphate synthase